MPRKPSARDTASIAAIVSRLLSHYWAADDPLETRKAQIEDWLEDLVEFEPDVVNDACSRWRRQPGNRRPTPGDIRAFASEEQNARGKATPEHPDAYAHSVGWVNEAERRNAIAEAKRISQKTDLQREGRDIVNKWAQEQGFADLDHYAETHRIHWSDAYLQCLNAILATSPNILRR